MRTRELQKLIDNNEISTEEQLSLMRDKIPLTYRLSFNELNDGDIKYLTGSDLDNKRASFINKIKKDETSWDIEDYEVDQFNNETVNEFIQDSIFSVKDLEGRNMLIWASENNQYNTVKYLLDYIDIDAKDNDGNTALMLSSEQGNFDIVRLLIKANANLNLQNNDGWTALMFASYEENREIVYLLTKAEADVNLEDDVGRKAIFWALKNDNEEIIELLRSKY